MYKFNFILSVFLIIMLFSFYVYAEYDRNKSEDISQDILSGMVVEDTTTISSTDDVWVIALDVNENEQAIESETQTDENTEGENYSEQTHTTNSLTGVYVASNGKRYTTIGKISIPSLNVNYPILSETTDSLLKVSVCRFWGCDANEVGNLCIAGHNYRNSRFFSKVLNLVVGDTVEITDLTDTTLKYSVYDKYTVDPTDVSCTSQLTNGKKEVTLITCTNDSKQRVVVKAREV